MTCASGGAAERFGQEDVPSADTPRTHAYGSFGGSRSRSEGLGCLRSVKVLGRL